MKPAGVKVGSADGRVGGMIISRAKWTTEGEGAPHGPMAAESALALSDAAGLVAVAGALETVNSTIGSSRGER